MVLGIFKHVFNLSSLCLFSWIIRIIYPCIFNIYGDGSQLQYERARATSRSRTHGNEDPLANDHPPDYSNAIEMSNVKESSIAEEPTAASPTPPPTYNDTLSSIRRQLPKFSRSFSQVAQRGPIFSRSISVSAQRYGRQLSNNARTAAQGLPNDEH